MLKPMPHFSTLLPRFATIAPNAWLSGSWEKPAIWLSAQNAGALHEDLVSALRQTTLQEAMLSAKDAESFARTCYSSFVRSASEPKNPVGC